jgi:hypothetical protein
LLGLNQSLSIVGDGGREFMKSGSGQIATGPVLSTGIRINVAAPPPCGQAATVANHRALTGGFFAAAEQLAHAFLKNDRGRAAATEQLPTLGEDGGDSVLAEHIHKAQSRRNQKPDDRLCKAETA